MEGNVGTAGDRHRRGGPGHQVVVSAAMVGVFVAHRADHRGLVGHLGQFWHRLAEADSRHGRGDVLKTAANLRRCTRLRVKALVMGRPTIQPDQDAVDRFPGVRHPRGSQFLQAHLRCQGGPRFEPQQVAKAGAQ